MLSLDNPFYRFCERLEEDLVKAGRECQEKCVNVIVNTDSSRDK